MASDAAATSPGPDKSPFEELADRMLAPVYAALREANEANNESLMNPGKPGCVERVEEAMGKLTKGAEAVERHAEYLMDSVGEIRGTAELVRARCEVFRKTGRLPPPEWEQKHAAARKKRARSAQSAPTQE